MGETVYGETIQHENVRPFAEIQRAGEPACIRDGAVDEFGRAFGTYMHGLFREDAFRHAFVAAARAACGLASASDRLFLTQERERRIDRLAEHVRQSLDMELIWDCLGLRK